MVYYLVEYSSGNTDRNLAVSPAGVAKMNYMISLIKEAGNAVTVCSAARTKNPKGFFRGISEVIDNKQTNRFRPTFGTGSPVRFYADRTFGIADTILFFLKHVKKKDTVVVYHEVYYLPWLNALHRMIGFRLVYEVEELYGHAAENPKLQKRECKYLKNADAFIYTTVLLREKVDPKGKPYHVIHGDYHIKEGTGGHGTPADDHKIHCLYSGTFSSQKGGALLAVRASEYLDEHYCLHVTGFGKPRETEAVQKLIDETRPKTKCEIVFDGFLSDKDYAALLGKSHIGLATQDAEVDFSSVCFQSKSLMYLSNGLPVVTARTEVMTTSDVHPLLHYYSGNDPKSVAEAIREIDPYTEKDPRPSVAALHRKAVDAVADLLQRR